MRSRIDYYMEFCGTNGKWYRARWTLWGIQPPSIAEIPVMSHILNPQEAKRKYVEMIPKFFPFNVRLCRRTVTQTETVEVIG